MQWNTSLFLQALTSQAYLDGAFLALFLATISQTSASILGFIIALGRRSNLSVVRWAAAGYIWFFWALPCLVLLIVVWNVLPQFIPLLKGRWYTPFIAGFIGLTLYQTAIMTEIIRSALSSVDDGQYLAAKALGFTPWQSMRKIIFPQMIKVALPPASTQYIIMVKLTSLCSVISLHELLATAQTEVANTYRYAEFYSAAVVYYLVIVSVLMVAQQYLETKLSWKNKYKPNPLARLQSGYNILKRDSQ